jgi:uncharacterized protein (DUF58 family)
MTEQVEFEQPQQTATLFEPEFLRRLEQLTIFSRRAMAGQLQGDRRSPKRGQSVEFADFRPYVDGDDIRRIDWNVYARLERFFLKLFVEEEDLTVHLLVDNSRSMDWGDPNKLWYARRVAGALGYITLSGLDRVTATALAHQGSAGYFPSRRGKHQSLQLFEFLGSMKPGGQLSLAERLSAYAASVHQPGPLVLLTDLYDPDWRRAIGSLLARRFEVSLIQILSPQEKAPEVEGDVALLDSETRHKLEVTVDYPLLQRYGMNLTAWQDEIRSYCQARQVNYIPVGSSVPFETLMLAVLRQRGLLR